MDEQKEMSGFLSGIFWSGCIWFLIFMALTDWGWL